MKYSKIKSAGFSLIELMIVLVIIAIVSSFAVMSFTAEKLYDAEKQALGIIDLLHEARQRSLSQRNTMRVEINQTKNSIRLIDEKGPNDASDDVELKSVPYRNGGVFIGTLPSNMTDNPAELSPVPPIAFAVSNHPLSSNDTVATMRFLRGGTVHNAGTNGAGAGSIATGATIYVWSKYPNDASSNPTTGQVFRAITLLGTTGSSRLWKCAMTDGNCSEWIR
jgi:prepilin-type N-terminal cleavage/methylation domain-containing protein